MKNYRELSCCRICEGNFYPEAIKLKDSPLANELYLTKEEAINADLFPLEVVECESCRHIQLKHIVDAERLFSNYVYASGTSKTFRDHFTKLAKKLSVITPGGLVLEVGSNDGTLLEALTTHGMRAIGVEPSQQLAEISKEKCEAVYTNFLDEELSEFLVKKYGNFDFVVGNNVFAHIDDLVSAFRMAQTILKPNGYLVFEVAHALKLVEQKLFDTIYHEHMSYHTVISLDLFMRKLGFNIANVEEIEMHGGSIRVVCQRSTSQTELPSAVKEIFRREVLAGLDSSDWMKKFNTHLDQLSSETKSAILAEPVSTTWFGYGAPAKAVTFINQFELDQIGLIGIIDDNPGKQGKFLPSSGIKVVSSAEMESNLIPSLNPTNLNCVIFPWNLSAEIVSKLTGFSKYALKVIWFLPSYKEVGPQK
jgi:SAM-dependent methyltransferase